MLVPKLVVSARVRLLRRLLQVQPLSPLFQPSPVHPVPRLHRLQVSSRQRSPPDLHPLRLLLSLLSGPHSCPVTSPVKSPVRCPVTSPVKIPVTSPVKSPVKSPVTSPVSSPVWILVKCPVQSPVISQVKNLPLIQVTSPVTILPQVSSLLLLLPAHLLDLLQYPRQYPHQYPHQAVTIVPHSHFSRSTPIPQFTTVHGF